MFRQALEVLKRREWESRYHITFVCIYWRLCFKILRFFQHLISLSLSCALYLFSMVNQFLQVFTEQILQNTDRVPKGLIMHVLDLYMNELAQAGSAEVKPADGFFFPFSATYIFYNCIHFNYLNIQRPRG